MKKMFMDAEKMTTKAYVKPVMKVVEVDVECLQTPTSPKGDADLDDPDLYGGEDGDFDDNNVKRYWF